MIKHTYEIQQWDKIICVCIWIYKYIYIYKNANKYITLIKAPTQKYLKNKSIKFRETRC